jgi:hypothetical protein
VLCELNEVPNNAPIDVIASGQCSQDLNNHHAQRVSGSCSFVIRRATPIDDGKLSHCGRSNPTAEGSSYRAAAALAIVEFRAMMSRDVGAEKVTELGLGILGGMVAWVATTLIGQPFYELIGLRREAARLLHMYDPETRDERGGVIGWLAERENSYRACAANLFAFSSSQSIVAALVALPPLRWHPKQAAELMSALAPLGPGAAERPQLRRGIAEALDLKL